MAREGFYERDYRQKKDIDNFELDSRNKEGYKGNQIEGLIHTADFDFENMENEEKEEFRGKVSSVFRVDSDLVSVGNKEKEEYISEDKDGKQRMEYHIGNFRLESGEDEYLNIKFPKNI